MLRMSADGTSPASLARNTAVPGTRCTPAMSFASSLLGTASFASAERSSILPLRQVQNTTNRTAPSVSGIQPPRLIFVMFPTTNTASMTNIGTNTAATATFDQFHWVLATNPPSIVVISIVPTTAAPYAPESALEEPNPTTKATTARNNTKLTMGT